MSTRYLALAIDEPGHFELGLDGLPLPAHHLVVVSEADIDIDGGIMPLPRVVALCDTGVPFVDEPPFLDDLLAEYGWNITDLDSDTDTLRKVVPADPAMVPAPVEYLHGRPQLYYLAGLTALREGLAFPTVLNRTVAAAALLITNPAVYQIHPEQVYDVLFDAAYQAMLEGLIQLGTALTKSDDQLMRELLATMCVAIGEQLDRLRDLKTCRTCDAPAVAEFEGQPVCDNTGH